MSSLEELLKASLEKLEQLEQHLETLRRRHKSLRKRAERAESLRRRYKSLKRRTRRNLERLQAAISELEEVERFGDDGWHVRNALEILYDVVNDLEVVDNE